MVTKEAFWDRLSKNYDKPNTLERVKQFTSIKTLIKYLKSSCIMKEFLKYKNIIIFLF